MSKLSFIDKLQILLKLSRSSLLFIIILLTFIVIGSLYTTTNKQTEKRNKLLYLIITLILLVTTFISYNTSISNMIKYMMDNLFIVIYFPNIAVYLAALIITAIITWISIFNYKTSKQIRTLNIVIYTIMNYILLLLLSVINNNNLDVFQIDSIYKNKEATALIELSSNIFITWIIFLIIYKIILIYLKKDYKPKVKKVIIKKKVKKLPDNYEPIEIPDIVYGTPPEEKPILIKEDTKSFDDMLTLEDYKKVLKLLKSNKEKEMEEQEIRKELKEVQNKYDQLLKDEKEEEKEKYEELLNLYR